MRLPLKLALKNDLDRFCNLALTCWRAVTFWLACSEVGSRAVEKRKWKCERPGKEEYPEKVKESGCGDETGECLFESGCS